MGYKQLDFVKRCQIYGLWRAGCKQTEIAKEIGVHKSTISRELNRNITFMRTKLGCWQYKPNYAQRYAEDRHKEKPKKIKFTKNVEKFVREKLLEDWSPEQISGYAKRHNLFSISHERIYQFILKDKKMKGELHKHLSHQNKKYRNAMAVRQDKDLLKIVCQLKNDRQLLMKKTGSGIGRLIQ
jgi:transposase, IS30 family